MRRILYFAFKALLDSHLLLVDDGFELAVGLQLLVLRCTEPRQDLCLNLLEPTDVLFPFLS